jgi:hypothetical protein
LPFQNIKLSKRQQRRHAGNLTCRYAIIASYDKQEETEWAPRMLTPEQTRARASGGAKGGQTSLKALPEGHVETNCEHSWVFFWPFQVSREKRSITRSACFTCSGSPVTYSPALCLAANMNCSCGVTQSPQFCKRRSWGAACFDLHF